VFNHQAVKFSAEHRVKAMFNGVNGLVVSAEVVRGEDVVIDVNPFVRFVSPSLGLIER
jgi:hypothetical protein